MNKIEVALGSAIMLSTLLFVVFLNQGLIRSSSGHIRYQFPAELSGWCLILLLFAGPATILHAVLTGRFVELGSGISTTVWTYLVWYFVLSILSVNYAEVGYIREFPTSHILRWISIAPNALWGAFVIVDGIKAKQKEKPKK